MNGEQLKQPDNDFNRDTENNGSSLKELTSMMNEFVKAKGWYDESSTKPQTPRNIASSLVIESSEVLEHFQWSDVFNKRELEGELADVALYLLQLASICNIDLDKAIKEKLNINYTRSWE